MPARQIEELSLQRSLLLNAFNHLCNTPPVFLGGEVSPVGEALELYRVGSRELVRLKNLLTELQQQKLAELRKRAAG